MAELFTYVFDEGQKEKICDYFSRNADTVDDSELSEMLDMIINNL